MSANLSLTGGSVGPIRRRRFLPNGELERDFVGRATTPVFLNEAERKRSITVVGKSVRVISRSLTADTNTNISVTGNQSAYNQHISIGKSRPK